MSNIIEELNNELISINTQITKCERKLKPATTDRIQVSTTHKKYNQYFYLSSDENGTRQKKLLKKSELQIAQSIIQQDYYRDLLAELIKQQKVLSNFLSKYNPNSAFDIYDKQCTGRQKMISPMVAPIDDYIKQWLDKHPGSQNPFNTESTAETNRHEIVKSKSEKIIADYFDKLDLVYVYETKVVLPNGYCIYPDFTILNKRTRETFYWEHLGLLGDLNYSVSQWKKVGEYESIGIELGKNLIISYEITKDHLNMRFIDHKIKNYLI